MIFFAIPRATSGASSAWAENEQARVRLVTPWAVAAREGELHLGLHFKLAPGWHVYWKNSGDSGYPPSLKLETADGILTDAEILWPAPRRYELPAGLVAFGYGEEVVYPVRARLAASAASEDTLRTIRIVGALDYVVCHEECIPYSTSLELDQPLADATMAAVEDAETAKLLAAWEGRVPQRADEVPGVRTFGAVTRVGDETLLEVRVQGATGSAEESDLFLETQELWNVLGRPRVKTTMAGLVFRVPVSPKRVDQELPDRAGLVWTVTGLERNGERLSLEAAREVEVRVAQPPPASGPARREADLPRGFLLAALGGLLGLATPAALALTVALLALLAADPGGRRAVREKSAAVATGALGGAWALVAVAQATGALPRFAERGEAPVLLAGVAVLATALALSLWGFLELPLGRGPMGTGRCLLGGLIMAPLALGWPLPPLAAAAREGALAGPFSLAPVLAAAGIGLALPFLVLALIPGLAAGRLPAAPTHLLPVLGFLAAGGAVWLLYRLSRGVDSAGLAWVELALVALALLAWVRARAAGRTVRAVLALALLVAFVSVPWLAHQHRRVHLTEGGRQ